MSRSVLVLAGLDPSGGAGLLADAETVRAVGARPLCVATALTVQTTRAARRFEAVDPSLVADSVSALLEEEDVGAVKIGMVGSAKVAWAISRALAAAEVPVVVDPVLRASSGAALFEGPPEIYLQLARGQILTPNLLEAAVLLGAELSQEEAARALLERGPRAVLVKGGHLPGDPVDLLATDAGVRRFEGTRLAGTARGTGCRLSSAMAASLAQGAQLPEAITAGRALVRAYLAAPR